MDLDYAPLDLIPAELGPLELEPGWDPVLQAEPEAAVLPDVYLPIETDEEMWFDAAPDSPPEPVFFVSPRPTDRVSPGRRRWSRVASALVALAVVAGLAVIWPRSFGGAVSYVKVSGTSMLPTFKRGDLVVLRSHADYRVGDVVAYRIPQGDFAAGHVVIHRIVGGSASAGFITRGDNRRTADQWHPRLADILGRQWFVVSGAGNWFSYFRQPLRLGALCGGLTFVLMAWGAWLPERRRGATPVRA
ncbi:MAG TPA: signal peptidase I [Acidimicrobiales bacterium]|nr:signal peptidase I [Acidimicrobiales bacterium]